MKKFSLYLLMFAGVHFLIIGGGTAHLESSTARSLLSGPKVHFLAFFALAGVTSLLLFHKYINARFPVTASFFYATFLAVVLELLQGFFSHRNSSIMDIAWGATGAFTYLVLANVFLNLEIGRKIKKLLA